MAKLRRAKRLAERPSVARKPETRPNRPLVLVAEDEAVIALELKDSLNAAGLNIAGPFATCADAEKWLQTGQPDAAILDSQLKDGPCDAVAADLSRRGVPMVIFSGHDDRREGSPVAWKWAWLTKPIGFPVLLEALRRQMHPQM
jgi:DNA-binding response OmpR family regulator